MYILCYQSDAFGCLIVTDTETTIVPISSVLGSDSELSLLKPRDWNIYSKKLCHGFGYVNVKNLFILIKNSYNSDWNQVIYFQQQKEFRTD